MSRRLLDVEHLSVQFGSNFFREPLLVAPESGLTCGAGRQCQTLALFLYEQGFGQFEFGYGSAIAVFIFLSKAILVASTASLTSSSPRMRRAG